MSPPQARWLSDAQVAGLLPAPLEAAELARSVLVGLADGTIELPPKPAIHPRPDAFVNTMPAYVGPGDGTGVKLVSVFPGNRERGLPTVTAIVIVLDSETGLVRGLLGGTALTACRTAAASAACAARLAPSAPGHVALTGAGVEARTHLLALGALGHRDVAVWDHKASNIDALRAWAGEHAPRVSVRPAARRADLPEDPGAWVSLADWLELPGEELLERHAHLYVPERDPRYLRRNALVALGNGPAEYRELARPYADDPDPLLRDAARRAFTR